MQIAQRPYNRCWSGNPIHYRLFYDLAQTNLTVYFEVRILFRRTDQSEFSVVHTFDHVPIDGSANIDIQDIIDGLLEHELPQPDINTPFISRKSSGFFYVEFRERAPWIIESNWVSDSAFPRYVVKGGISYDKWRGDNYWLNYFDTVKPFFTWQLNGRMAGRDEPLYLAWLNYTDINPDRIKVMCDITYVDGTVISFSQSLGAIKYDMVLIPVGAEQLNLLGKSEKRTYTWSIQIKDVIGNTFLSEKFVFELDNRVFYNEDNITYRNSLGGIDSVRIRGVVEESLQRTFTTVETASLNNYFEGHFILPRIKAINATEWLIKKGNVGHVSKEEQDRLRDLHFNREAWQVTQGKWLPLIITTENEKLRQSDDFRWGLTVTYAIASNGDRYYTPQNIDLQEGNVPETGACSAVINNITTQAEGNGVIVAWDLESGTPPKFKILVNGQEYETNQTMYTIPYVSEGDTIITIKPVCLINGAFIDGAGESITYHRCVPVELPEGYHIPEICTNDANYAVPIIGTTPIAVNRINVPAYIDIDIIDGYLWISAINPPTGNVTVHFSLSNCSGTTIEYNQIVTFKSCGPILTF